MEIRISFNGSDAADAELTRLMARTRDMDGALNSIGRRLVKVTRDRFGSQTDPDGKPWAPLSPLTVVLRGGSRRPILTRSGRLKGSVVHQVAGARLELGSNTIDANVHQYGAVIRPVKTQALFIPLGGANINRPRKGFGLSFRLGAGGKAAGFLSLRQVTIPARRFVGWGAADQRAAREGLEMWLSVDQGDGGQA